MQRNQRIKRKEERKIEVRNQIRSQIIINQIKREKKIQPILKNKKTNNHNKVHHNKTLANKGRKKDLSNSSNSRFNVRIS